MKKKQKKGESEMNLRDLFCQFPQSVLRTVSLPEPENSVSAALLLTPGTALLPDYLYVGPASVLPPELPETALNLLLDREPPEAWCQGCNVAVLEDPDRMGSLFNDIQRQLDRQQQSLIRIGGLFSASLTHGGLQHLIGQAAELLGNPLMLLQNDGRLLAWQSWLPEKAAEAIHWENIQGELEQEAWTPEHMAILERDGILERRGRGETAQVYFDAYMGCTAAVVPVRIGGVEVAWLHLAELRRPIAGTDLECFGLLAQLLSREMQKSDLLSKTEKSPASRFLQELLETPYPNGETALRRLEALHFPVKDSFYLAAMQFSVEKPAEISFEMLELQLRPALHNAIWCVCREQFVILYTVEEDEELDSEVKGLLRRIAIVNHMTVGVSNAFSTLDKIPAAFAQTQTAIRFGRKYPISYNTGRPLCQYFQYSFLEMLETCSKGGDLLQYCSPMLLRLLNYDQKNGTDLMNTLYEYLENSRNINQTAEALYVHKNTLLNRLNRIRAVMNCDMDNSWDRFLLSLSFRVLFYKNIYRPDVAKREWKHWDTQTEK